MQGTTIFIIAGGVIGLVVFAIVMAIRQEKKRAEALRLFAQDNGFSYEDKAGGPGEVGLPEIELFNRGHSKRMTHVMAGEVEGSDLRVLEYRYTTGSGKNSSTSHQTVVAIATGGVSGGGGVMLPDFTLARENFFHKIGQAFGYQDIDFDMFPEFSKKYLLRGSDEEAVRALFNGRVIDAYMNNVGVNVESRGGWLFVFAQGKRLKPEDIQPRIECAFGLLFELTGV